MTSLRPSELGNSRSVWIARFVRVLIRRAVQTAPWDQTENSRAVRMEHRFAAKAVVRAAPQVRFASRNVVRFAPHSFAATDQDVRSAPHVMVWDRLSVSWTVLRVVEGGNFEGVVFAHVRIAPSNL